MLTPDWTHFRSADGTDPSGPCCLTEGAFSRADLPANYIWTIGYIGEWPKKPALAEISAQVKSYSVDYLRERSKNLEAKRAELQRQQEALRELKAKQEAEAAKYQNEMDMDNIKRKIAASPLDMAKGLVKSAADLASGGMTDPAARMDICNACPFKGDDNRCGRCGCFLPAKTRVKKSSCPIGAW